MSLLNHSRLDVLKLDVESSEFGFLDRLVAAPSKTPSVLRLPACQLLVGLRADINGWVGPAMLEHSPPQRVLGKVSSATARCPLVALGPDSHYFLVLLITSIALDGVRRPRRSSSTRDSTRRATRPRRRRS